MFETVNFNRFVDAFRDHDRIDQFTYEGKQALFDYLEQYEEETGERIELDVIALCVGYSEYANLEELQKDYPDIGSMESLSDNTTVIEIPCSKAFIIQSY